MWAEAGFRPVDPAVAEEFAADFPEPKKLWTIDDLGGWSKVNDELFDPDKGSVAKIYDEATGVAEWRDRRPPAAAARRAAPAGRPLGLGVATLWLSVIVLLPLAAVVESTTAWARSGTRSRPRPRARRCC